MLSTAGSDCLSSWNVMSTFANCMRVNASNSRVGRIDLIKGLDTDLRCRNQVGLDDNQHRIVRTVERRRREPIKGQEEFIIRRSLLERQYRAEDDSG